MRALIYTRVSHDSASGRSPAEQETEARQVCAREGWDVVDVATDSRGASRHSKGKRDGWARAKAMLGAGDVDVLVTWEASRAQRDLAAYAELRQLCSQTGVRWNYSGRTYDMSSKDDRFSTGLDALLAEREADETAHRVQRAIRANAVAGRPHGRVLYGYERVYDSATGALVRQEAHLVEADVVRRIFRDYLGGFGTRTLARALNDEGVRTRVGAAWSQATVRGVLTNPGYVARRKHQGQVIGDAAWPALVDVDTFERAQRRLEDQRTSTTRHSTRPRLLTTIGRCGVCGGRIISLHDRNQRQTYTCRDKYEVSRDQTKLDGYVGDLVVERLCRPDVAAAFRAAPPDPELQAAAARVGELRAQLDEAIDAFTDGKLTAATLAKIEAKLLPEIAEAERSSRRVLVPLELDIPAAEHVRAWYDNLTHEVRREVVGALLAAVTIHPTGVGRRVFDPTAIKIEWRR